MPPEAEFVLRARGVSKRFDQHVALREVSFDLQAGELTAIVGPNGAGKTTLLSILAGVAQADAGELMVPVAVGWVPQQPAVYSKLSVAENLRLFARLEGVADPPAMVEAMLGQTGLGERRDDPVARLSGGNQQRVNIAIGLLSEPSILLLDEPSASLDPRQRERLWEFVARLAERGTTVLYSTHDIHEVERHADRILVLDEGELCFIGTASELERAAGGAPSVESAFLRFLRDRPRNAPKTAALPGSPAGAPGA